MAWAVRGPSSAVFAPSVYQGVSGRRSIALTFDDGPSEGTGELLDLLSRYGVRATFFQCGANARRLPRAAREVADAGHEIGNHTDTHPRFDFTSSEFQYREMARAQESLEETTGARPAFVRAPFGVRWFGLREAQARLGLLGVMWSTLALDWKLPADRVVSRLMTGARNGAILCLHDGRELQPKPDIANTVEALRIALPMLIDRGFQFEKVSQILCPTI